MSLQREKNEDTGSEEDVLGHQRTSTHLFPRRCRRGIIFSSLFLSFFSFPSSFSPPPLVFIQSVPRKENPKKGCFHFKFTFWVRIPKIIFPFDLLNDHAFMPTLSQKNENDQAHILKISFHQIKFPLWMFQIQHQKESQNLTRKGVGPTPWDWAFYEKKKKHDKWIVHKIVLSHFFYQTINPRMGPTPTGVKN